MSTMTLVFPLPRVTLDGGPSWNKARETTFDLGGRVDVPLVTTGGFVQDELLAFQVGPQFRFGHTFNDQGAGQQGQSYAGGGATARAGVGTLAFDAAGAMVVPVANAHVGVTSRGPYIGAGASLNVVLDHSALVVGPCVNYTVDYSFKGESASKLLSFGLNAGVMF